MPFIPPNLALLWERINSLDEDLSTYLGRYKIKPTSSDQQPKETTLLTLIARANLLEKACESERTAQKEVISKLVGELRTTLLEGDEAKCCRATKILLGALLHRYFRLINEYKTFNDGAKIPFIRWSVYSWDVKDCKLFHGIRAAFAFNPMTASDKTPAIIAGDLESMDVTTIITSLEEFKKYMYKDAHYKEFPHLNQLNFKPQLEEIILAHKSRGAPTLTQFNAISFMQSFVNKLNDDHGKLNYELEKWHKTLGREHANLRGVSVETIEAHMAAHIPDPFKEKAIDLLHTPFVKDELPRLVDPMSLSSQLIQCNSKSGPYLLIGVCSLILESESIKPELKQKIYKALGIMDKPERLACSDKKDAIGLLIEYNKTLSEKDKEELNMAFFGDFAHYETQLSRLESRLIARAREVEEDAVVVSASM